MAVFTGLDSEALDTVALAYGLAAPLRAVGISRGVENTNYFVDNENKPDAELKWVLTILEQHWKPEDLSCVLSALEKAGQRGLPVPLPEKNATGSRVFQLASKPALLSPRLSGSHALSPSPGQCAAIGHFLGAFHSRITGSADKLAMRNDPRGLDWLLDQVQRLPLAVPASVRAAADRLDALRAELQALPSGICHGDLFRDNALFEGENLGGVIDWYNAALAPFGFDLAVVINDWCLEADGSMQQQRILALLEGYMAERPLRSDETALMPELRRWAGLRFWLSRITSQLQEQAAEQSEKPDEGKLYEGKDPQKQLVKLEAASSKSEVARWREIASGAN